MAGSVSAQDIRDLITVRSRTGQFVVRAVRPFGQERIPQTGPTEVAGTWGYVIRSTLPAQTGAEEKIRLDPALLVVSCERLKEMFLRQIGQTDQWRGRINLTINPRQDENEPPQLTAVYRPDGWVYEVILAKSVSPKKLVHVLTHALLLEVANRKAGEQSAEPPLWLVDGLAANLQANNLPTYVIEPGAELFGNRIKLDGLSVVREKLHNQSPLTFSELSWPDTAKLADPEQKIFFQTCAQLFVSELLHLKNGKACMTQTLQRLSKRANWQIAFLEGFHSHFAQLRDVEKWWALTCFNFTGRDISQAMSYEDSWKKIRQALDIPVQIHVSADALPVEGLLTLQEVIQKWTDAEQIPTLQRTLQTLSDLRPRAPSEMAALINQYEVAIQDYLQQRNVARPALSTKNETTRFATTKTVTCRQLSELDKKLEAVRAAMQTTRHQAEVRALNHSKTGPDFNLVETGHFNSPKSR